MMRLLVVLWLILSGMSARAEVYQWTDADGQVHFSDRKPMHETGSDAIPDQSYLESRIVGIWAGSDELGNEHSWIIRRDATLSVLVIEPGTTWRLSVEGRWKINQQTIRILVDSAQLTSRMGDTTGGLGWDVMLAEIIGVAEQGMTLNWNDARVDLRRQQ